MPPPARGCLSFAKAGVTGIIRHRNLAPQKHSRTALVICNSKYIKDFPSKNPSATIFIIQFTEPLWSPGQSLHSRQLQRLEHTGIHLALYFQNLRNHFCISSYHTDSPSRHIMSLTQGIKLQTALHRSRLSQNRDRTIIKNEAVRIVITYQYPVPTTEIHELSIKFFRCRSAGGHIGIVCPHYLHPLQIHLLQCLEIRPPSIALAKIIGQYLRFHKP